MGRDGTTFALEAPRPRSLVGIALVCAAAGFGLSRASLDVDRAALAERADEAREAASAGPAEDPGEAPAVPEPPVPQAVVDAADASAPAQVAPFDAGSTSSSGGVAEVVEGRVAYLRCEGLPNVPPAGPCPRDMSAEAKVWDAIRALPNCPALADRSGHSDVRVVFDGARVSGLGFRDLPDELDRESVRGCLEPMLERVRTGLGTSRMTASFRFELIR